MLWMASSSNVPYPQEEKSRQPRVATWSRWRCRAFVGSARDPNCVCSQVRVLRSWWARNGSGKSSFAEAAEFALTGSSLRWAGKSVDWKNGWRNLHAGDARLIEVALRVEGERAQRTVRVRWTSDRLESAETVVIIPGRGRHSLDSLGWSTAVKTFRPFLPYKELSAISEGRPIDRYRALMPMLGMESL